MSTDPAAPADPTPPAEAPDVSAGDSIEQELTGTGANSANVNFDWSAFYAHLAGFAVTLPTYQPGDAINPHELHYYLGLIQNRRQGVDDLAVRLDQRIGLLASRIESLKALITNERIMYATEDSVVSLPQRQRKQAVEEMLLSKLSKLGLFKATLKQAEAARRAVDQRINSLQTAKETLNAQVRIYESAIRGGHR